MKKLLAMAGLIAGLSLSNTASAGIPVIDAANLANSLQQVIAWGKQYAQMKEQFENMQQQLQQAQQTFTSLNGARGMESLVNNPALRQYLPSDYQSILNGGYGNSNSIRAASKLYGIENTTLNPNSAGAKLFESQANQAALNRAMNEEAYKQAGQRFSSIQVLLDKVGNAPEAKDIADLQARIQAEQVMLQNENVKLNMLAQLQQSQRDLAAQQSKEIRMSRTTVRKQVAF